MKLEAPKDMAERLFPPLEKRVPIAWDWDAAEQAIRADRRAIAEALGAVLDHHTLGTQFDPIGYADEVVAFATRLRESAS